MVKKKRPSVETREESSDSSSEQQKNLNSGTTRNSCQHIKKSVDTLRLRKVFKTTGLASDCTQCLKNDSTNNGANSANADNQQPPSCEDEFGETGAFEYDNTLWLCLKCGTQLCGRSRNQHALRHFKTPHSDFHALTMNTRSFEIWCYECDNEISVNSRSNLAECVDLVRKISQKVATTSTEQQQQQQAQAAAPSQASQDVKSSSSILPNNKNLEVNKQQEEKFLEKFETIRPCVAAPNNNSSKSFKLNPNAKIFNPTFIYNNNVDENITLPPPPPPPIPGIAKRVVRNSPNKIFSNLTASSAPFTPGFMSNNISENQQTTAAERDLLNGLPRVRGLTNLGNTCFFNAVMQCLAQTPYLLDVLRELSIPGEEFTLPGGTFQFKDQEDLILPKITGTLTSWGSLTAALANVLEELQMGGGVFTPNKLFDKLCSKCPQFCGGDQHDAHELLRHLLESVRSEDLKRYQRVILDNLGYKDAKVNCADLRQKCKIYGDQASDRILRPDQVFRGFLVSTLTCQDCFNVSSRHEYFLDISLPVNIEKPQPPQRRKNSPDNGPSNTFYVNPNPSINPLPSKAQLKKETERERKEKRAAKLRNAKAAQKMALVKENNPFNIATFKMGNLNANGGSLAIGAAGIVNTSNNNNDDVNAASSSVPTSLSAIGTLGAIGDAVNTPSTASSAENKSTANSSESEQSDADVEDNLVDDTNNTNNKVWRPIPQTAVLTTVGLTTLDYNGNNEPSSPIQNEKRGDSPERIDKDSLDEDENDSGIATSPVNASISNFATSSCSSSGGASNGGDGGDLIRQESDVINVGITDKAVGLINQLSDDDNTVANTKDIQEDDTNMNDSNLDGTITKENVVNINGAGDGGNDKEDDTTLNTHTIVENDAATAAAVSNVNDDAIMNDNNKSDANTVAQQIDQLQLHEQIESRKRAKRMRTQSYSDWSTTIAPRYQCKEGECSIQMCLNNFTAVELMTRNNKVGCDNCTKRMNGDDPKAKVVNTNATKQFLISSPPAVLILHLKRFQLGPRCIFRKLSQAVIFPMVLDIAPFCGSKVKNLPNINRKQKKLLYALYGIVEHSGGMYGGHYKAFVKVRPRIERDDKRWKFLPEGSRAELDQDDEQRKRLEELLAKEKARDICGVKASDDSDDFSSLNSTSLSENDEIAKRAAAALAAATAAADNEENEGDGDKDAEQGAVGGDPEADGVQVPIGKWYYVSDSRVTEVTEEEVLKAQAYLLFYERIY